jgi:hypothetical protein
LEKSVPRWESGELVIWDVRGVAGLCGDCGVLGAWMWIRVVIDESLYFVE